MTPYPTSSVAYQGVWDDVNNIWTGLPVDHPLGFALHFITWFLIGIVGYVVVYMVIGHFFSKKT